MPMLALSPIPNFSLFQANGTWALLRTISDLFIIQVNTTLHVTGVYMRHKVFGLFIQILTKDHRKS